MAHVSSTVDKISDKVQQAVSPRVSGEGEVSEKIQEQTARIPAAGFFGLAVGSMLVSAGLAFIAQRRDLANFVGLWAPSLLLMGVYNKLVKMERGGGTEYMRH